MRRNIFKFKTKIIKTSRKESLNLILSFIRSNTSLPKIYRQQALIISSKKFKNLNFSKIPRFCLLTGKTRFILKNLHFSRMFLKKFMSTGYLCGFYKSS